MTIVYCLLAFAAGFVFGIIAIALVTMAGDKKRRDEDRACKEDMGR